MDVGRKTKHGHFLRRERSQHSGGRESRDAEKVLRPSTPYLDRDVVSTPSRPTTDSLFLGPTTKDLPLPDRTIRFILPFFIDLSSNSVGGSDCRVVHSIVYDVTFLNVR